ncbi:hypothetical protein V8J85_18175 [Yoonia sp. 2307UL14-13]|uniref:hypothetical protein n=1 Tax=Yoonia sp. 2307UL14-13 TaxID=3126506 RepID=UPI0030B36E06
MTDVEKRGGAPVGLIADLEAIPAASVMYLRMWFSGPDKQSAVWNDMARTLGSDKGRRALQAFESICSLCGRHGRRPLVRHAMCCKCVGSDEACFANFISTAADGEREDTLLMATLLVRPDMAPALASLAVEFGIALKQMNLASPKEAAAIRPLQTTLH